MSFQRPKLDVTGSIHVSRSTPGFPNVVFQTVVGFGAGIKVYLPLACDEATDMECICTTPTPKPPTAPASRPSSTSRGKLSSTDFFLFAILCFLLGIGCRSQFSICASIPGSGAGAQQLVAARDGRNRVLSQDDGEEFFT